MAQNTIGLIFRPASLGGKSVEEIFSGLIAYWRGKLDVETYTDDLNVPAFKGGRQLREKRYSLTHFTGGAHRLIYFLWGRNILLTVHDIGRLKELNGIRRVGYYFLLLYIPFRIATRISTVSEFSKRDLINHFPFLKGKHVQVIPNPVPERFRPFVRRFNKDQTRILLVGTQPHKNNARVIQAVRGLSCTLIIIGKLSLELENELQRNSVQYESFPDLSYDQVYEHYCQSDLLVFASLHEGFGMPILEAQAVGRPVVASRIPPHQEIADDSVLYVHPERVHEIREAIREVIENDSLREQLIEKGNTNIQRFRIDHIAAKYEALYRDMLKTQPIEVE